MITRLFFAAALLAAGIVHAQVACQTFGNTTNCNGSLAPPISPIRSPDIVGNMIRQQHAQAAEDQAGATAELARQQADLIRLQAQVLQQQQTIEAQRELQSQPYTVQRAQEELSQRALDQYLSCVAQRGNDACARLMPQTLDVLLLRPQAKNAPATDLTLQLKAKTATLSAIMRASPPDSTTFRNAASSLEIFNEAQAKRGSKIEGPHAQACSGGRGSGFVRLRRD